MISIDSEKKPTNSAEEEAAAALQPALDEHLIINEPSLQKPFMRGIELIFSAGMWLMFLYLLQIFLTSTFWVVSGLFVYHQILAPAPLRDTKILLLGVCYYALAVFLVLFGWANWNYWRYGRLERRKPAQELIPDEVIAMHYNIAPAKIALIRSIKLVKIIPQASGMEIELDNQSA